MTDEVYEVEEWNEDGGQLVEFNPEEKIRNIIGFSEKPSTNMMEKVDNRPLFELASNNLNRMGEINISEKIRRILE